ncbi:MAG: cation:proton antiporter [Desulfobacterales bacterium]
MKIFFSFLLIIFLAFSGYHLTFRGFKLPLFARRFYLTGTEFLFLGLLLGPHFTNIINTETSIRLEPITTFLLGWTGLLFGFQFELRKMLRFPIPLHLSALLEGMSSAITVFGGAVLLSLFYFEFAWTRTLIAALALCAVAVPTAQTGLAMVVSESSEHQKNMVGNLKFVSGLDGLIAMLILGVLFFFRPSLAVEEFPWLQQGVSLLMVFFLFVGLFLLFGLFFIGRLAENEMVLVVIAMTVIAGGAAAILNFSPLLMNFLVGICLANMVRNKERIFNMLVGVEKPVYLLILLFLGVNWYIPSVWVLGIAAGYSLIIGVGKIIGGFAFKQSLGSESLSPLFGLGLISPGGLTFAILLDLQKGFPYTMTTGIIGMALIAVMYNDMAGPHVLKWLIRHNQAV